MLIEGRRIFKGGQKRKTCATSELLATESTQNEDEESRLHGMKFSSRLHVGGLAPDVTADEISRRLAPFGDVVSVDIKLDKFSTEPQQCRGFAFVDLTVSQESEIDRCMSVLNHCRWKGRKLVVSRATPHYTESQIQTDAQRVE